MAKSATDIMQEIIFSAVTDALDALKASSKGVPNALLRDVNAIHANSTFADLPRELQSAIAGSVRSAFNRLMKEGYSVSQGQPEPVRRPPQDNSRRPPGPRRPQRPGGGPAKPRARNKPR
ncbi:MAG TPA: hypothetical protein VF582_06520 [Allosphingosinicella sp.]|jgi:hypothetical protein